MCALRLARVYKNETLILVYNAQCKAYEAKFFYFTQVENSYCKPSLANECVVFFCSYHRLPERIVVFVQM